MTTVIKTKNSSTTTNVPTGLAKGELAVNVTDKKLWVGDGTNSVQIAGQGASNGAAGSNRQVQYNNSGALGADSGFVYDSSGNLGLGVTPSAWNTGKALSIYDAGSSLWTNANGAIGLMANGYYNSGWKYQSNGYAMRLDVGNGNGTFSVSTAPSGTAGNAITFTQAMTLTANSELLVNTTTNKGNGKFCIKTGQQGFVIYNGVDSSYNELGVWDGSTDGLKAVIKAESGVAKFGSRTNSPMVLQVNDSEKARIDTSGNLLVGKTSNNNNTVGFAVNSTGVIVSTVSSDICALFDRKTTTGQIVLFRYNDGDIGNISTNGSATAYNTTSDYRLKESIAPMTGALATVSALKPVTYKWKSDGSDGQGFIAHELQAVVPDCVTGEKDAVDADGKPVYQGIDTSFLVATLTSAIQELKAIVDAQAVEIQALKGTAK